MTSPRELWLEPDDAQLVEQAARLTRCVLEKCRTLDNDHWQVTGSCALSWDWHHRTGDDIDVVIAPGLSMSALGGTDIEQRIQDAGGHRQDANDDELRVTYPNTGTVHITSREPELTGLEERLLVNRLDTQRVTKAQIFLGKLRRAVGNHASGTDLVDIWEADRRSLPGLAQAVNVLTEPETARIHAFWHASRTKLEHEIDSVELQMKRPSPAEAVTKAIEAIDTHRYAAMRIEAMGGRTSVYTRTRIGRRTEYHFPSADGPAHLRGLGVLGHVRLHNVDPMRVLMDTIRSDRRTTMKLDLGSEGVEDRTAQGEHEGASSR